jgi:hypothetical protein
MRGIQVPAPIAIAVALKQQAEPNWRLSGIDVLARAHRANARAAADEVIDTEKGQRKSMA